MGVRDQPDRPSLIGVPAEAYDGSTGIELRSVRSSEERSVISAEEATNAARRVYAGGSVRQVVLAQEINANAEPDRANVVWVLNFDPATVKWHRPAACGLGCAGIQDEKMETTYALRFIDAQTGADAGELLSGCRRLGLEDLNLLLNPRQHILDLCPQLL